MANNIRCELFNDHHQNYKRYHIPKAQLVIADIPYNLGNNAYASSPEWYVDGDNKNGESNKAGKAFFDTDHNFKIAEFMHFCSKMLIKEPKEKGKSPCMIVFCAFQQMQMVIEYGNYTNLEAAHIKPKSHKGSFRPNNGIAMSRDMHWAFDKGFFSLTDEYKIQVHPETTSEYLWTFNDKQIKLPVDDFFKPDLENIRYHRENVYGFFCK